MIRYHNGLFINVFAYMYVCIDACRDQKGMLNPLGAGVAGCCESSHRDAGKSNSRLPEE